jgi:hypothetical protein
MRSVVRMVRTVNSDDTAAPCGYDSLDGLTRRVKMKFSRPQVPVPASTLSKLRFPKPYELRGGKVVMVTAGSSSSSTTQGGGGGGGGGGATNNTNNKSTNLPPAANAKEECGKYHNILQDIILHTIL